MDELLIEDKKYVSSKRAAQMTGYAKDYVGQLCREGRVPARLVGRGWYVLETAIQDHRFGQPAQSDKSDIQSEENAVSTSETPVPSKWEPPRYESLTDEFLPSVNRLRTVDTEENNDEVKTKDETNDLEYLQDTWKTWFDHVANSEVETTPIPEATTQPIVAENVGEEFKELEAIKSEEEEEDIEEEKPVDVPIHAVYRQPPQELLPRSIHSEAEPQSREVVSRISSRGIMAIQVLSIIIGLATATLAFVGTGYLDKYIISNNQARIFAGAVLYNK